MMKFVITCSGPLWAYPDDWIDRALLVWYDPDFNKGEGRCEFTYDISKAQLFDSLERAVAYVERAPINSPCAENGIVIKPIRCFEVAYRAIDIEREKRAIKSPGSFLTKSAAKLYHEPMPSLGKLALAEVYKESRMKR